MSWEDEMEIGASVVLDWKRDEEAESQGKPQDWLQKIQEREVLQIPPFE